ncbi:inorganic diphosphatase [Roridomyces roridus]|uniref:inorganic diphosphatase n=1 Tax=Roridomyces roridus TaxID=1738132 RepID=A0AAD7B5U8_9AGAR|nr:inorganic diphosphatase [Roridomyces roridus]
MPLTATSLYVPLPIGTPNTPEHRVYISHNGHTLSALHDIPLLSDNAPEPILNMVVEAPRWSNAQMGIAYQEPFTPIRQAVQGRSRRLAYVRSCFPHRGFIWNYGSLPQTWSEGAPLHVCEIGEKVAQVGQVCSVRILGLLAPRDEGVLRYTLLAINTQDPLATVCLHTLADLEQECPGLMTATKEWFRLYKLPDGKPENTFELNGQFKDSSFAEEIIRTAHAAWHDLVVNANSPNPFEVDLSDVTIQNSPGFVQSSALDAYDSQDADPAPIPPGV